MNFPFNRLGLRIPTIGFAFLLVIAFSRLVTAQDARPIPRCEIVPLPADQVSLRVDGEERIRWHHGQEYERPFFFPFIGPSGASLTRIGHPGAPNHDHHRSIWIAHHDLAGNDFWSNTSDARIRQKHWYDYVDGDQQAVMAVALGWYDSAGEEVMASDLVAALRPLYDGEQTLEIQLVFRVPESKDSVEIGKSNFGFLAVRVAKTLSGHFGGGTISGSEGGMGETQLFGKPARWIDYSGPVRTARSSKSKTVTEGITFFDHPANPRYPTHWHLREDGWMGASFGMKASWTIEKDKPLTLRYLLHAHTDHYDERRAAKVADYFASLPAFEIVKSDQPHRHHEVRRIARD